jgi:hypothetical protein
MIYLTQNPIDSRIIIKKRATLLGLFKTNMTMNMDVLLKLSRPTIKQTNTASEYKKTLRNQISK